MIKPIAEHEDNLKRMKQHLEQLNGSELGYKRIFNHVVKLEETIAQAKKKGVKRFDIRKI